MLFLQLSLNRDDGNLQSLPRSSISAVPESMSNLGLLPQPNPNNYWSLPEASGRQERMALADKDGQIRPSGPEAWLSGSLWGPSAGNQAPSR